MPSAHLPQNGARPRALVARLALCALAASVRVRPLRTEPECLVVSRRADVVELPPAGRAATLVVRYGEETAFHVADRSTAGIAGWTLSGRASPCAGSGAERQQIHAEPWEPAERPMPPARADGFSRMAFFRLLSTHAYLLEF